MGLYHYQQKAIEDLEGMARSGKKKLMVYLATASGKSHVFKELIQRSINLGNKVCFVVYGKSIVEQAAQKHFSDISKNVSIIMAEKKYKKGADVYCCSISTLARNHEVSRRLLEECSLFIIDECHHATSSSYVNFLSAVPNSAFVVGFTATPFLVGKKGHTFWDDITHPITTLNLVEQGFLSPPRIFGPPQMETKDVRTVAGEYSNSQLFTKNDNAVIYGDIVKNWLKIARDKKTICFAINRTHAKNIRDSFLNEGIPAAYADAETPQHTRLKLYEKLARGEIKILCNVDIASTGLDIPEVDCVISARPTKSLILWVQQAGRALRICEGKTETIIIDHGGNTKRLGHILEDFPAELKDQERSKFISRFPTKDCPECFFMNPLSVSVCGDCGFEFNSSRKRDAKTEDTELVEIIFDKDITFNEYKSLFFKHGKTKRRQHANSGHTR